MDRKIKIERKIINFSNPKKQSQTIDFTQYFGIDLVIPHEKYNFEINQEIDEIVNNLQKAHHKNNDSLESKN